MWILGFSIPLPPYHKKKVEWNRGQGVRKEKGLCPSSSSLSSGEMCLGSPQEIQGLQSRRKITCIGNRERRACTCLHVWDRVGGVVGSVTCLSRLPWGRELSAINTVWVIPTGRDQGQVHHVRGLSNSHRDPWCDFCYWSWLLGNKTGF